MPANQSKRSQGKSIRNDACFNPFNLTKHSRKKTLKLRKVNASQLHAMKIPVVNESLKKKICDSCRLRINKLKKENDPVEMVCNYNEENLEFTRYILDIANVDYYFYSQVISIYRQMKTQILTLAVETLQDLRVKVQYYRPLVLNT